jgi:predicted acyltransferase
VVAGVWFDGFTRRIGAGTDRYLSDCETHLDAVMDLVQRRLGVLVDGLFVVLIECLHLKKWAFPLVVAGLNPITLYCLWQLSAGFVRDNLKRHISPDIFLWMGETYEPMLQRGMVLVVLWLVLFCMYRRKMFIRI